MDDHISHLKKVHLSIRSISGSGQKVVELLPVSTELIVGLHPEGLTIFESKLMDKQAGEEFRLHFSRQNRHAMLGHITIPLPPGTNQDDDVEILVKIAKVSQPSNREVVKAMADLAGGGCGSDCDCGCGH